MVKSLVKSPVRAAADERSHDLATDVRASESFSSILSVRENSNVIYNSNNDDSVTATESSSDASLINARARACVLKHRRLHGGHGGRAMKAMLLAEQNHTHI